MAAKKYHTIPGEGVKECSANKRKCPYQDFSSYQEALYHYQTVQERDAMSKDRVRDQFIERLQSLSPSEYKKLEFDLRDIGTDLRYQSYLVKQARENDNITPMLVDVNSKCVVQGDNGKTGSFRLNKKHSVTRTNPPEVQTFWEVSAGVVNESPIIRQSFPLMSTNDGREFKKGLATTFDTMYSRIYSDPQTREREKRKMIDKVVSMINTVETMERGAVRADALGFSYFKGSTPDRLVARAGYSESGFDEHYFEQALQSENYNLKVPQVTVQMQDSLSKKSSNYWTIRTDDGYSWTITTTVNGEKTMSPPLTDAHEIASRIKSFSSSYVTPENQQASLRYNEALEGNMVDFIQGVGLALDRHKIRVEQNLQAEHEAYIKRNTMNLPKKGGVRKLFGLLK